MLGFGEDNFERSRRSKASGDLTAEARIGRAEEVVREQRVRDPGSEVFVRGGEAREDCVEADDFRDLGFELVRLQRAVMGEPEP